VGLQVLEVVMMQVLRCPPTKGFTSVGYAVVDMTHVYECQAINTWLYGEVHHEVHSMVRSSSTCALTELLLTTAALRTRMRIVHCYALRTPSFQLLKAAHVRMCALKLTVYGRLQNLLSTETASGYGMRAPKQLPSPSTAWAS
jgi:hypothetical protein